VRAVDVLLAVGPLARTYLEAAGGVPERSWAADADEGAARRAAAAGMCAECHFGTYAGDGTIPRLAGQTVFYLEKTMADFKSGERNNSPAKTALMATFSDEDIRALASNLAGL